MRSSRGEACVPGHREFWMSVTNRLVGSLNLRNATLFVAALALGALQACGSNDPAGGGGAGGGPSNALGGNSSSGGVSSGPSGGSSPSAGGAASSSGGSASSAGGASSGGGTAGAAGASSQSGGGGGRNSASGGSLSNGGGSNPASGGAATANGGASGGSTVEYPLPNPRPSDENGAKLWLRYPVVPIQARLEEYKAALKSVVGGSSPTLDVAKAELTQGLSGLIGQAVTAGSGVEAGSVVLGTATSDAIKSLPVASKVSALGPEGYWVEATQAGDKPVIAVTANTDVGVLYGAYALLRHLQSHEPLASLSLSSSPKIKNRILDHWDNLDGSVERGYAGSSIWKWGELPGTISPKYKDYARANASIGINGTVLTNVNANAQVLKPDYLKKVKAIADTLRPYGIKVYLTARFSAPKEIGGLSTADPLDSGVKKWWSDKANEIYELIPDFGGFVVKANSEGQPGPQEYNRSHADGANTLADALGSRGIVMWRAFVYSSSGDRIRQAYDEFHPLDGKFKSNVLVQVKNGPLDFQPREPFSQLFGAMPKTPLALEVQITKEYLGEDTHLAYLGTLYEEVLKADVNGNGGTVAKVVDGELEAHSLTAMAGVSNVGSDTNWTGSHFNQANWYVFGRMAWDPASTAAAAAAEEWVRQTFSNDPLVVAPVVQMMMGSRQTLVNYMTPLGLAHIMGTDHHYGPAPWVNELSTPEWNPYYYHKADSQGIGFDRTSKGSNAVSQYAAAVAQVFGDRTKISDDFLLFFHRVQWTEKVKSGRSVWEELVHRYSQGVDEVGAMRDTWKTVEMRIDAQRFKEVGDFLQIQHYEARWWRDACLAYFGSQSKLKIPDGYAQPNKSLAEYQAMKCPSDVKKPRCPAIYSGNPSPAITKQ